jgi:hypothetical protein
MNTATLTFLSIILLFLEVNAQSLHSLKGTVLDAETHNPIINVTVTISGTTITQLTDADGNFAFKNIPTGNQLVQITFNGYESQNFPINTNDDNQEIDLGTILLFVDLALLDNGGLISLTEDELNDDIGGADNISGLLSSSRDVFLRTAAFEFSPSFFRVRGLDSDNANVLINGIKMNKIYNGRPQWSNWGGLNDVLRNQELTTGLAPSSYTFGGVLGATNINTRASQARAGGRVTYSSTNRSYTNRVIASYASGLTKNDWAYTISLGRRWGNEGYLDATSYNANSFFVSAEKKLNDSHSLNFTGIYAANRRGKSSPNTQEIFDLKDIKYNEYWGYQNDKKRNSRIKEIEEPILMLNHYWDVNDKTKLNTNVAYQFGKLGNSRLDYNGTDLVNGFPEGGGANPSPAYYQKLPSYFLRNNPDDLGIAFGAQQEFINNGQINWDELYFANTSNTLNGGNAIYALYEDRVDDTQLTINSILNMELNDHVLFDASLNYKSLKSENFAQVDDLLGANGYLDIDSFANDLLNNPDAVQNDLLHPNKIVGEGEIFKYNYNLFANILSGFAQAQFKYNKVDFFLSGSVTNTNYQREGIFQNGSFPDNSLGKGDELTFTGFGAKAGFTYKITGKHIIDINGAYLSRAPSLRNTFSNARENHDIVGDRNGIEITEEKILTADANYVFRSPKVKAKLTGYYTKFEDATEISFFFADGIGGDNTAFVQEVLQGIDKLHIGGELGIEYQIIPTVKLKGVASVGQYTYDNNPNLTLTTEPTAKAEAAGFENGFKDFGQSNLKNYRIASGSQKAFSVGFEYRDPNFWWFGATTNYFDDTYLDISPLTRTSNFTSDFDGNVFNDYDEVLARELLQQEKFEDYFVVNLVGGKSWKIDDYYIGFFASVNNLLDKTYKTGGFEQGRNANFRELRDDKVLNTPVFSPKYWYGRGTTYFVNVYIRF